MTVCQNPNCGQLTDEIDSWCSSECWITCNCHEPVKPAFPPLRMEEENEMSQSSVQKTAN